MANKPTKEDALATIRFAIFDALITQMPKGSHDYLEQAADVAAKSLDEPQFQWALEHLAWEQTND